MTSALPYPFKLTRMYNPQTQQCVDILSDFHESGQALFKIEGMPTNVESLSNSYTGLLTNLHRSLNGHVNFICEFCKKDICSDLATFQALNIVEFTEYTKKAQTLYPMMQPFIDKAPQTEQSTVTELVAYLRALSTEYEASIADASGDHSADRLAQLVKILTAVYNTQSILKEKIFALKLFNELAKSLPQANLICSDEARCGVLDVRMSCTSLQPSFIASVAKNATAEALYSHVKRELIKLLFNSLLILEFGVDAIDGKIANDEQENIPAAIKQLWETHKTDHGKMVSNTILPIIATLFCADFAKAKNTDVLQQIIMQIFPQIQQSAFALFETEVLVNIFSCNEKRIVACMGDLHSINICKQLETLGFVNVAGMGFDKSIDILLTATTLDHGAQAIQTLADNAKCLDAETVRPLLFENPQVTYQNYLFSNISLQ